VTDSVILRGFFLTEGNPREYRKYCTGIAFDDIDVIQRREPPRAILDDILHGKVSAGGASDDMLEIKGTTPIVVGEAEVRQLLSRVALDVSTNSEGVTNSEGPT